MTRPKAESDLSRPWYNLYPGPLLACWLLLVLLIQRPNRNRTATASPQPSASLLEISIHNSNRQIEALVRRGLLPEVSSKPSLPLLLPPGTLWEPPFGLVLLEYFHLFLLEKRDSDSDFKLSFKLKLKLKLRTQTQN